MIPAVGTAHNLTEGPWQFDVLGEKVFPIAVRSKDGRVYWASIGGQTLKAGVSLEVADFGVTNVLFGMHQNFATLATTRGVYYTWVHGVAFSRRLHDMPTDMLFTAIGGRRRRRVVGRGRIVHRARQGREEHALSLQPLRDIQEHRPWQVLQACLQVSPRALPPSVTKMPDSGAWYKRSLKTQGGRADDRDMDINRQE